MEPLRALKAPLQGLLGSSPALPTLCAPPPPLPAVGHLVVCPLMGTLTTAGWLASSGGKGCAAKGLGALIWRPPNRLNFTLMAQTWPVRHSSSRCDHRDKWHTEVVADTGVA